MLDVAASAAASAAASVAARMAACPKFIPGGAGSYDVIEGLVRLVNGETNKVVFARCNSYLLNKSFPISELSRRTYPSLDT